MHIPITLQTRHAILADIMEIHILGPFLIMILGFLLPVAIYLICSLIAWIAGYGHFFMRGFLNITPLGLYLFGITTIIWDIILRKIFSTKIKLIFLPLWLFGICYFLIGLGLANHVFVYTQRFQLIKSPL
jgi:hypothetical protein